MTVNVKLTFVNSDTKTGAKLREDIQVKATKSVGNVTGRVKKQTSMVRDLITL